MNRPCPFYLDVVIANKALHGNTMVREPGLEAIELAPWLLSYLHVVRGVETNQVEEVSGLKSTESLSHSKRMWFL